MILILHNITISDVIDENVENYFKPEEEPNYTNVPDRDLIINGDIYNTLDKPNIL